MCGWAPRPAAPSGQAQLGSWGVDLALGKLSAPRDPAPSGPWHTPLFQPEWGPAGAQGLLPLRPGDFSATRGGALSAPIQRGVWCALQGSLSDARRPRCPGAALPLAVMVNYYHVEGDTPGAARLPLGEHPSPHPAGADRGQRGQEAARGHTAAGGSSEPTVAGRAKPRPAAHPGAQPVHP